MGTWRREKKRKSLYHHTNERKGKKKGQGIHPFQKKRGVNKRRSPGEGRLEVTEREGAKRGGSEERLPSNDLRKE